jgi:hypothetical protein
LTTNLVDEKLVSWIKKEIYWDTMGDTWETLGDRKRDNGRL